MLLAQAEEETGCCTPIFDEDPETLTEYEDEAEVTSNGRYRCRDCGMLFDTLEEHDVHHRNMHGRIAAIPNQGMSM